MNADRLLISLDNALRTLTGAVHAARPLPAPQPGPVPPPLSEAERRLSGALMRVNHVGEVCAQALYQAQALTAATRRCANAWPRRPARRSTTWPGPSSVWTPWATGAAC
jgi:demethoxyubiquinone hydroxylase (CLK1/Coq7/Cat5 family)